MSDKKALITKVVVQMGNTSVEMTLDEAKELQKVLNEAFPTPSTVIYRDHYYNPYPRFYWNVGTAADDSLYISSVNRQEE